MQLGVNLLCATGLVESEHFPLIEYAAKVGFDGVEIPVLEGDPDHYAHLGDFLDQVGLRRTCTAIIPSPDCDPTSEDESVRSKGIAHLDWIVECAQAIGAETIGGPFHAPLGHFTGTGPSNAEWQRGAEAHRDMAAKVEALGIKLALEPLNRFETHFLNIAEHARHYCDLVDHPAFGIMYDTYHAHIEEKSQVEAIATYGDKINVLHVSENDRGVPGTGQINFPDIFHAVKKTGFDGWVVLEAFGTGVPELAAATRIWRPMFESHEQLFRDSSSYIKNTWRAA